jgi:3-phosphoshikimate 1-carboxyvinyltransferase
MGKEIKPVKRLSGEVKLPGDKSISHRAVILGAIASGVTRARGVLDCDDCNCTIDTFRTMGITIKKEKDITIIEGKGLKGLSGPKVPLNVGESGTTMRLLAGILSGQDFEATLTGAPSLSRRPMKRVIEPLSMMGARITSRGGDYPPLIINGSPLRAIDYEMPMASAQVKSAILLAGLYASGVTSVAEKQVSRDHTERMLTLFDADVTTEGTKVSVKGGRELAAKSIDIPGDISAAAFFIAGATILAGSKVRIDNVGVNPTRAGLLNVLSRMGANIKLLNRRDVSEPAADMVVESAATKGTTINREEIPSLIDELPVIFVIAAVSRGETVIEGAGELRVKETDRISSMQSNLKAMGAGMEVDGDDIIIEGGSPLKGAGLKSFGDHRTCMSMAIAALAASGKSAIDDIGCVNKSFPGFFGTLEGLYVK